VIILNRYLARHVARATLAALFALAVFFSFVSFMDELGDVGKGGYSTLLAASHVLLGLPRLAYELFPAATLVGTMIGLGLMANSNELTVIRASGVPLGRIIGAVFRIGAVFIAVSIVFGEFVAPASETWAQQMRTEALTGRVTFKSDNGFWARDGKSFINIRGVLPDGRAEEVVIYEFDETDRLRIVTRAGRARHTDDRWLLEDIRQSRIGDGGVTSVSLDQAEWVSLLEPGLISLAAVNPEHLSMYKLFRYAQWLRTNNQDDSRYEYVIWSKLSYPLATAVMILLAVPFAFGSLRTMGLGTRIVIGVMIGICFHLFNQTASHLSQVYGLNAAVSAMAPTLLVLAAAVLMLRRVD